MPVYRFSLIKISRPRELIRTASGSRMLVFKIALLY
jgi:hypothetical protein